MRYVDTRTRIERQAPDDEETGGSSAALSRRRALTAPTDSTDELWHHARTLFAEIPRRRALTKTIGVTLINLHRHPGWQGQLFSDPTGDRAPGKYGDSGDSGSRADRQRALDRALDALRAKHGFGRCLRGTSFPLTTTCKLGPDGFRLRTPSLNQ